MFTGIIVELGKVLAIESTGDTRVTISTTRNQCSIAIGASIACSGVCLTVVEKGTGFAKEAGRRTGRPYRIGPCRRNRRSRRDHPRRRIPPDRIPRARRPRAVYRRQGLDHDRRRITDRQHRVRRSRRPRPVRRQHHPAHIRCHHAWRTGPGRSGQSGNRCARALPDAHAEHDARRLIEAHP